MLDTLASSAMTMGHSKEQISEKILNHALEIIYLLTGEKYVIVKKKFPHCCIHPKSGGVPVKCDDVAVYFSMEEWDYVKGHKEDYQDVIMDTDATSNTIEITENADLELPDLHAGELQCTSSDVSADTTADASTEASSDVSPGASTAGKHNEDSEKSKTDKDESVDKDKSDDGDSEEDASHGPVHSVCGGPTLTARQGEMSQRTSDTP